MIATLKRFCCCHYLLVRNGYAIALRGRGNFVFSVRIGIVPPLELVTCSHVFSPQLPLNQTCKLSSPTIMLLGTRTRHLALAVHRPSLLYLVWPSAPFLLILQCSQCFSLRSLPIERVWRSRIDLTEYGSGFAVDSICYRRASHRRSSVTGVRLLQARASLTGAHLVITVVCFLQVRIFH